VRKTVKFIVGVFTLLVSVLCFVALGHIDMGGPVVTFLTSLVGCVLIFVGIGGVIVSFFLIVESYPQHVFGPLSILVLFVFYINPLLFLHPRVGPGVPLIIGPIAAAAGTIYYVRNIASKIWRIWKWRALGPNEHLAPTGYGAELRAWSL
jgi:hypothetical protein